MNKKGKLFFGTPMFMGTEYVLLDKVDATLNNIGRHISSYCMFKDSDDSFKLGIIRVIHIHNGLVKVNKISAMDDNGRPEIESTHMVNIFNVFPIIGSSNPKFGTQISKFNYMSLLVSSKMKLFDLVEFACDVYNAFYGKTDKSFKTVAEEVAINQTKLSDDMIPVTYETVSSDGHMKILIK